MPLGILVRSVEHPCHVLKVHMEQDIRNGRVSFIPLALKRINRTVLNFVCDQILSKTLFIFSKFAHCVATLQLVNQPNQCHVGALSTLLFLSRYNLRLLYLPEIVS